MTLRKIVTISTILQEKGKKRIFDIVKDDSSFFDCVDDRPKAIISQDHIRRFLSYFRAANAHRDPNIGTIKEQERHSRHHRSSTRSLLLPAVLLTS